MTWAELLDLLEARTSAYAAVLRGGPTPRPIPIPVDLGPCPPALRARGALIVERHHDLENAFRDRLALLRGVMEPGDVARAGSIYIDAQA